MTLAPPQSASSPTQQGSAQSGKPACAGKKGCAPPALPSATTCTADDSTGVNFPALATPAKPQDLPDAPSAQIPYADLKPLFDYVPDCRSCQAKRAAAKQDSTDNAAKLAVGATEHRHPIDESPCRNKSIPSNTSNRELDCADPRSGGPRTLH
jgi:hypothetical protein